MFLRIFFTLLLSSFTLSTFASSYGSRLCEKFPDEFDCYKVKRVDTWDSLFPGETEQDTVIRINRSGNRLTAGKIIAIPKDLDTANVLDFAPMPRNIDPPGEPLIMVTLSQLAWGAYDADGNLVRWGPTSSAKGYCPDIHKGCHTPTGKFKVYNEGGPECKSTKFPVGKGGAPMPYCMFFHGGYALHGSYDVPGYNASHGCIRLLIEDAKWLNQEFVEKGTRVIIEP